MIGVAVLLIFYGSAAFCIVALIVMMTRYVRAPLHLNWELYRGSSVYELPEWWTRSLRSFSDKIKSIIVDILFLRQYYQRNRRFWYFLFPFHFGLYLLILWHVWLFASAAMVSARAASGLGTVWGYTATAMVFVGSIGILVERITEKDLRAYYPAIHYAKWVFIVITLATGFYAVLFHFGGNISSVLTYVNQQLAFHLESKLNAPAASSAHLLIVAPWLIYLPFSHITKLFLRYYHELRWDNKPNLAGTKIERNVKELLEKPISWSAPHIQSGRSWSEVAQGLPEDSTETKA